MTRSWLRKIIIAPLLIVIIMGPPGANANITNINEANFGQYAFPTVKRLPGGMGYAVGGNYFMRLGSVGGTKPIISITPPDIRMGCGGLSIRGMFMSFLGLDELSTMLSDSGTTVAWGLMLGLVESLPSISQTLEQVQTFVRNIQKLLANSCQTAKILAQRWQHKPVIGAINDGIGSINTADHSLAEKIKKWNNSMMNTFAGLLKDGDVTDEKKGGMISQLIANDFATAFGTWGAYLYAFMNRYNIKYSKMGDVLAAGGGGQSVTTQVGNYTFETHPSAPLPFSIPEGNQDRWRLQTSVLSLLQSFGVPDTYVLQSDKLGVLQTALSEYAEAAKNGDDARAKKGVSLRNRLFGSSAKEGEAVVQPILIRSAAKQGSNDLLQFLEAGDVNGDLNFIVPSFAVLNIKAGGQEIATLIAPTDVSMPATGQQEAMMKSFGNIRAIARAQVECLTNDQNDSVTVESNTYQCGDLPPVFIGSARKLLRIYAQSLPSEREKIKEAVISRNEILMRDAVLNAFAQVRSLIFAAHSRVPSNADGDRYINTNKTSTKAEKTMYDVLSKAVDKLKKLNRERRENLKTTGIDNFDDYMDRLDRQNKQRGLKDVY